MRAPGVIRAAPRVPIRSGSIDGSLWGAVAGRGSDARACSPTRFIEESPRVLEGIRVVDASTEIAGAYCTKLLADAGADVVKVEPPGGDPLRSWGSGALFDFLHTSKRSVVATPGDTTLAEWCATADVVVDTALHGLDVGRLREQDPSLVVASITPFG